MDYEVRNSSSYEYEKIKEVIRFLGVNPDCFDVLVSKEHVVCLNVCSTIVVGDVDKHLLSEYHISQLSVKLGINAECLYDPNICSLCKQYYVEFDDFSLSGLKRHLQVCPGPLRRDGHRSISPPSFISSGDAQDIAVAFRPLSPLAGTPFASDVAPLPTVCSPAEVNPMQWQDWLDALEEIELAYDSELEDSTSESCYSYESDSEYLSESDDAEEAYNDSSSESGYLGDSDSDSDKDDNPNPKPVPLWRPRVEQDSDEEDDTEESKSDDGSDYESKHEDDVSELIPEPVKQLDSPAEHDFDEGGDTEDYDDESDYSEPDNGSDYEPESNEDDWWPVLVSFSTQLAET